MMSKIILTIPRQPHAVRAAWRSAIDPVLFLSLLMAVILVCSLPVSSRFAASHPATMLTAATPTGTNLLHEKVPAIDE